MSFRRVGGLNYSSKHNYVSSSNNATGNLLISENVGLLNTCIHFESNIDASFCGPTGSSGSGVTGPTGPTGPMGSAVVAYGSTIEPGAIIISSTLPDPENASYLGITNYSNAGSLRAAGIKCDAGPYVPSGGGQIGQNTRQNLIRLTWNADASGADAQCIQVQYIHSVEPYPLTARGTNNNLGFNFYDIGTLLITPYALFNSGIGTVNTNNGASGIVFAARTTGGYNPSSFYDNFDGRIYVEWISGNNFITLWYYNRSNLKALGGTDYQTDTVSTISVSVLNTGSATGPIPLNWGISGIGTFLSQYTVTSKPYIP